ncbi:MAG: RagB/SusD family nutrient uptake outer membrane protein [Dysgonamonadaceae bacterium]|jgi:hypothetical protein|nr:RagB/SusD family nutrient uptake outer membrane protein [Dysgonamonadaceae bacterium]
MKNIIKIIIITGILVQTLPSCSDYLDIVPDNTVILEDYFSNQEKAYQALAKVYAFLPEYHSPYYSPFLFGDDWLEGREFTDYSANIQPIQLMKGQQSEQNPIMLWWEHLYRGIRAANTFLENVDAIPDMSVTEKAEWRAQITFLKAYFHFIILQHYGPIAIVDANLPMDASKNQLMVTRQKVEDCFDYIISRMDEAIPDLSERLSDNDLGMVDRGVALAIKARVMLLRASPFFNGNRQMYGDFLDYDGQPFFPMDENPNKWQDALNAVNEAITFCLAHGKDLYTYDKGVYPYDKEDYDANPTNMKTYLDLRYTIVDAWNKELVWGRTYNQSDENTIQSATGITIGEENSEDNGYGAVENYAYNWNWLGATYAAMLRYYTKNGLPTDVDKTFDKSAMFDITTTPDAATDPEYRGILQPNVQTISMYLDREPRFYANLGITGGYWRQHHVRMETMMLGGTGGGYWPGRNPVNWFWSGIGVKKFVHPESKSGSWIRQTHIPYPIIRMADLYLMKAEILNEINGPGPEAYAELNKIRRRAGIPDVEVIWADPNYVGELYRNRHLTKDGLRDIILEERAIELAFEGSRFRDMWRYKRATAEFTAPNMGWIGNAFGVSAFFKLEIKTLYQFTARDYLFPISLSETNINSRLIQNPGWR